MREPRIIEYHEISNKIFFQELYSKYKRMMIFRQVDVKFVKNKRYLIQINLMNITQTDQPSCFLT